MAFLNFVPSGVVFPFAGATAPDGWLLCNGAAVSRSVYATLFSTVASAHGSGDGSTTFNLPDYRGRVMRGRDGGIARDPDRAGRTAAASGGNTGDNVGSVQAEATKRNGMTVTNNQTSITGGLVMNSSAVSGNHGITVSAPGNNNTLWHNTTNTLAGGDGSNNGSNTVLGSSFTATAQTLSSHTLVTTSNVALNTGDSETRPINAYVNYIIKI